MNKLLISILLLAFTVRVWNLASVPASLYVDEVDMGVQARSILETGKDYLKRTSPFYIRSYNSDRTPIPVYLVALTTKLFNSPELQIRMAPALVGSVVVLLMFYLVLLLSKSVQAALITSFVCAVNPWLIQFSRIGFEAIFSVAFFLISGLAFFIWLKNKKVIFLYSWILLLSASLLTYRTMSLWVPIAFITWFLLFRNELLMVEKKHLVGTTLVLVIISSSFLYSTTIAANDQPRINQISIFADKEVPVWVQRNREIDSGDLDNPIIGKQPVWWSKFFHNKIVSWWKIWKNNYLETFSTQFLFFNGDPNLRHSTSNGMFLTIDILGLIFGIYYLLSNLRIKNYKWLLVFLLLSPIPSSLTKDGGGGHHASRLILVGTFLVLIIGLGWWRIYERLKKIRFGNLIKVSLIFAYIICFSFYYHHYQVHYRLESARSFSYGYKQAIEKILNKYTDKGFSTLKITQSIDPPLPYLWFFNSVPAKDIQEKGLDYGGKMGTITKIETINWLSETSDLENISETILPNQLYLLSERDIVPLDMTPKDKLLIDILETVRFPDNEPAFYLLARKD